MTGTVRWGVLGCADVARRRVLPALVSVPGATLVAVASRTSDRAAALAARFGAEPVTGYAELLGRDDIDAVYVPLPPALHASWIAAALRAGKHVLAEKPLTTSVADTAQLARIAGERGRLLRENFMFLHHPRHALVRRLVEQGRIGRLRTLDAEFTIPRRPVGDIRYDPGLGGGALLDNGAYPLRLAHLLLGPDLHVAGAALSQDTGCGVDTGGAAVLTGPDQVLVTARFGLDDAYHNRYRLIGTEGTVTVDRAFTPPADVLATVLLESGGDSEEFVVAPHDQCRATVAAFTEDVLAGGCGPDGSLVRQAELVARVAAAGA
jgi:predicted dehydrogenase